MKKIWFLWIFIVAKTAFCSQINKDYTVIPFAIIDGFPIMNINVQGKEIPLGFDLGATHTWLFLNASVMKNMSIHYTGKWTPAIHNVCGGKFSYKVFIIPTVQVGDLIFKDVKGYEYTASPGCASDSIKNHLVFQTGLIGTALIKPFRFIIDYPKKKLILIRNNMPKKYSVKDWQWLNFEPRKDDAVVTRAIIGGKNFNVLWDTGSNRSVLARSELFGMDGQCAHYVIEDKKKQCIEFQPKNLIFGNHSFEASKFYVLQRNLSPHVVTIGADFFMKHAVYIDFKKHKMAIDD